MKPVTAPRIFSVLYRRLPARHRNTNFEAPKLLLSAAVAQAIGLATNAGK